MYRTLKWLLLMLAVAGGGYLVVLVLTRPNLLRMDFNRIAVSGAACLVGFFLALFFQGEQHAAERRRESPREPEQN